MKNTVPVDLIAYKKQLESNKRPEALSGDLQLAIEHLIERLRENNPMEARVMPAKAGIQHGLLDASFRWHDTASQNLSAQLLIFPSTDK